MVTRAANSLHYGVVFIMQIKAVMRYVRVSPTKVRRLADLVRGESVANGLEQLRFLPHRGARLLEKLIHSARSNAEEQGVRSTADLIIGVANVDSGPTLKRMQPHARGMGFEIKKRTSHITVVVRNANPE
jgi:large subunit ribosomal protein L22